MKENIIVALDTHDRQKYQRLVDSLSGQINFFKVGKELFTAFGIEAVEYIQKKGGNVFLDLKYYDIPNTVANAAEVVTKMGVKIFNVHASGGTHMMKATSERVRKTASDAGVEAPIMLAVTVLTSFDEEVFQKTYGTSKSLDEMVLRLASMTRDSGFDGVVASAKEVIQIKENVGKDFIVLTPGIRPSWSEKQDQARVVTPKDAFQLGSDYIVIGRPITGADDPEKAAAKIIEELNGV